MLARRQFLTSAAAAAALAALPRRARAASPDRKFVFVLNNGGWDPTRVFAPEYDNGEVAMEYDGAAATAGGIVYVDHPDRPSVRSFLQANHSRCLVVNGVLVRAISHELCTTIALTGQTSGATPDWPAILAASKADQYTLPHLVIGGPSYSGNFSALVARTGLNGQLDGLLTGSIAQDYSDIPVPETDAGAVAIMDSYLARNVARRRGRAGPGQDALLADNFGVALDKAVALRRVREQMDFQSDDDFASQARVAANALSKGLSRCVSLAWPTNPFDQNWDSHVENDETQSSLFEGIFAGLTELMAVLDEMPGEGGGRLSDETTVVVFSEMGRSPQLNNLDGKDHWPYTSVLLIGSDITGDRVVGAFDEYYNGSLVEPSTGEPSDAGELPSAEMIGATLLTLGDVDPAMFVSGASPLDGVLR